MRTLDSIQEERSKAATLRTVPLLVITTYSDRDAKTEGDVFYISDHTVDYKWGAGAQRRFLPWLLLPAEIGIAAPHIPHAANSLFMEQTFSFTLNNGLSPHETGGTESYKRVIELLRENYPLEGATVEFAQLLIDSHGDYYPLDLTAYDGDEHTPIYRGRIAQVGPITEATISFSCVKDNPEIEWTRADDATKADPHDLGARYPKPYGQVKKMPLVAQEVGWVTTLAEAITAAQTGQIDFTDLTGIPDSAGSGQIAGEEIAWTGKTGNSLDGVTRAQAGTTAAAHQAGEILFELILTATYIVSDGEVDAIDSLYALNPFNGELTRISVANYTKTLTAPAKVTFSTAKMRDALAEMAASAAVTQQPARSTNAAVSHNVTQTRTQQPTSGQSNIRDGNIGTYYDINNATSQTMTFPDMGTIVSQTIKVYSYTSTGCNLQVNAGGVIGTIVASSPTGWYSFFTTNDDDTIGLVATVGSNYQRVGECERTVEYNAPAASVDTQPQVAETGGTEVQVTGASMGFGLRLFADVDGAVVPDPGTEWAEVYDLDDDPDWSVSTGVTRTTDVAIYYPGSTASQKLVFALTVQIQCESADSSEAAQWSTFFSTVADEGTIITEGGSSVKGTSTSNSNFAEIWHIRGSTIDLTAGEKLFVLFDIRIDFQGASGGDISFFVGNDLSNYKLWTFPDTDFTDDTWHTVVIDYEATADDTQGSPDFSVSDLFGVRWNDGGTQVIGMICYVDNIRTIPKVGRAQRNSLSPTLDMSSYSTNWRYALRVNADAKELLTNAIVYFDNSSSSGTTLPSPVSSVTIANADFGAADAWVLDASSDSGAGDEDAVQTIALAIAVNGDAVFAQISGSLIAYFDTIQAEDYLADNYDAAVGALIEKPTDIFVHWCQVIGGVTVETVSLAASLTNLGSDKLAVDMRGLTPGSWIEGLAGIAYHSRANIVPAEAAAGTVYKILTAESDYEYPAADRTLTAWQAFSEVSLTEFQIFTRWACLYAYNPVQGNQTDENYSGFLRADEDSNDLSDPATGEIQTSVDKFGNSEAPVVMLLGIDDEATAKDIFGYYVHEGIRGPRMFAFDRCPWWEVYDLEVGDIVTFDHPWGGATLKARVLSYVKNFASEANSLRCLEVS